MVDRKLVKLAQKLWNVPEQPREVNRYNRRAWLRSIERLGDNWLLKRPQPKLDQAT